MGPGGKLRWGRKKKRESEDIKRDKMIEGMLRDVCPLFRDIHWLVLQSKRFSVLQWI